MAGNTVVDGRDNAELRMLDEGDVGLTERAAVAGWCRVRHQHRIESGAQVDPVAGCAQ